MFTLKVENKNGEVLTLRQNKNYAVTKIEGLNPPSATINFSEIAGVDGGLFNSSRVEMRNIVLTIKPLPPVEKNRLNLYKYFNIKQWCKIYYSNASLDVQTEGYIETIEANLFSKSEEIQVSIMCPKPYFESLSEIYSDISKVVANFEFPFAIEKEGIEFSRIEKDEFALVINSGDIESGVIIEIVAKGAVTNPIIYNTGTGGMFGLNITLNEFDKIVINTNSGEKGVHLISGGVETNIINKIMSGVEWFKLTPGDNTFSYDATSGTEQMSIVFRHSTKYGGV